MDAPLKHVRLLFSADLHGAIEQYQALAKAVVEKSAPFFRSAPFLLTCDLLQMPTSSSYAHFSLPRR